MFDLGGSEVLLLLVVALLVLGPRELSRAAFMIGNFIGRARSAFSDMRLAFEDMSEELESAGSDDASENKEEPENKEPK